MLLFALAFGIVAPWVTGPKWFNSKMSKIITPIVAIIVVGSSFFYIRARAQTPSTSAAAPPSKSKVLPTDQSIGTQTASAITNYWFNYPASAAMQTPLQSGHDPKCPPRTDPNAPYACGFSIIGSPNAANPQGGLGLSGTKGATVTDVGVHALTTGIKADHSEGAKLTDVDASGNTVGVDISHSKNAELNHVKARGNGDGSASGPTPAAEPGASDAQSHHQNTKVTKPDAKAAEVKDLCPPGTAICLNHTLDGTVYNVTCNGIPNCVIENETQRTGLDQLEINK
jgi:hypothetical protein